MLSMSYTKYLRWGVIVGVCLVPFISFIVAGGSLVPGMFFPYITGKNFTFRILVEVLLLLYAVLALREPKYRPKASLLMWALGAFVLWMGVATIFSVDPLKSFWSNFERMDGYITVLHLFALFIVSSAVLTAEKLWEKFFQVSIASSVLMGIYAMLQLFGALAISTQSGSRVDTTFGNATYLAVYMLFNVFITLFMLVRERKSVGMRWFYGIAIFLQVASLYFTETRGAILGLLGGLIIGAIYIAWRAKGSEWQGLRRASWITLGVIAILIAGFFGIKETSIAQKIPGLSRLASISLTDPTTQSRFIIWNMAIKGSLERPVTGWGQENFNYIFNEHYDPAMYNQEQWFDRAHNEFLDWFVAGGLPAFLLYISFFVLAAWVIMRSEELAVPEAAALLGLLAAYGFNNLFVFDNLMSLVYFYLVLAFLHGLSWKPLPRWMFLSKPLGDHTIAIVAPVLAVLILGGGWMLNAGGIVRAQTLIDALQSQSRNGATITPAQHVSAFKDALALGPLGFQETAEQLFQFASNSVAPSTSGVSPELKQEVYTMALSTGNELLLQRPNDARLELFMSMLLAQFNQPDEALAHLKKAAALSPKKQQILFQLGTTYLQKGDSASAVAVLKSAFDLAPTYDDARVLYAGSLYYAGQKQQADALLTERFGTVLVDNDQLLQIYNNTKQHDRVIGIWQARVAKSPKDAQIHLGLAAAYFASGNVAQTIAELQKIAILNPAMAGEAQNIIKQIQAGTLKPGQ